VNREKIHLVERLEWGEDILALTVFFTMVFIPTFETIARFVNFRGIPASPVLVQHLTLWIGFLGAILAARQNKLLALTTTPLFSIDEQFHFGRWIAKVISFIVVLTLMWGSWELLKVEFTFSVDIAPNIPRWFTQAVMPFSFGLIAIQILINSTENNLYRSSILMMAVLWIIIGLTGAFQNEYWLIWIGLGILGISVLYGAPIFVGLGGAAVLFFWGDFTPISAIPAEMYRIVVSPTLPTIPLFTLAGYILAESGASRRMIDVFSNTFGWIKGGTPVVVVLLCGFFTALTGGSGVTILALGGLLYPLLRKSGYSELFSLGLITVSGSLGLLFPPSLPAIIYSVTAGVSVKDVFIAGLIPGTLLVAFVAGWAIFRGEKERIKLRSFQWDSTVKCLWIAKWELIIPILILYGVFGGFTTLVETAAITVVYILIIETLIYRDLPLNSLPKIVVDCATLVGGVLIILGVAMGVTSYLVDAQIPMHLLSWVKETISSKYIFLLLLNGLLLLVGCMMDIFSAIIVIVPLIIPLGHYFGVDPVHLAIIFIANLELGFLTPPVGMNLFLAAYRFDKSMPLIYKATLPFFVIRFLVVLLITYLPIISLGLIH
jgi:tripartite ATP-independent transporter DctM subunit